MYYTPGKAIPEQSYFPSWLAPSSLSESLTDQATILPMSSGFLKTLWSLHRRTLPGHQSGASWLILANTQGKCPWLYQEVQMMPRVCRRVTHSPWQPSQSELPLALRHGGNGHSETTAKGYRSSQILTSRHQLLHQMDRSKTTPGNYDQRGGKIHLETLHLPVWPPIRNCHQQRHSIQSSDLWRLPDKTRHQAPSHLCRSSSD